MNKCKKVIPPQFNHSQTQSTKIPKQKSDKSEKLLSISFEKFHLKSVCLDKKFNNHFKDKSHFAAVAASILGVTLPKVTSHTYKELSEGGTEGNGIHFHTVDKRHLETVREILSTYGYKEPEINQMFEGSIIQFSGITGHTYVTRVICHKVDNILYPLFLDTNHHIYINEKYVEESLFYEDCPVFQQENCKYMPSDCFAVGYLDLEKLKESFGFTESPS